MVTYIYLFYLFIYMVGQYKKKNKLKEHAMSDNYSEGVR